MIDDQAHREYQERYRDLSTRLNEAGRVGDQGQVEVLATS